MQNTKQYIFGPVPSRRLGLSLGIDLTPFKTCTQDCLYCQLGKAPDKQYIERKPSVPLDTVIEQLKDRIDKGVKADYITLSGSGEPTLNSQLGQFIDTAKTLSPIPVAVITNSTLLPDPQVRVECAKADLLVPSLDAADQQTFEKINRPHHSIKIEDVKQGLLEFKKIFKGLIWLEIFLLDSINDSEEHARKLSEFAHQLKPDKIQLNTAVRPTAEAGLLAVSADKINRIAQIIDPRAEVIADFSKLPDLPDDAVVTPEKILDMLQRRPCSLHDIAAGLNAHPNEVAKYINALEKQNKINSKTQNNTKYYHAKT